MGHFLTVTAFRSDSVPETARAISEFLLAHEVKHDVLASVPSVNDETDALLFAAPNQWVIVLWPGGFNVHDFPLASEIGRSRPWLISTVHVYDGDFWEHLAVQGPEQLHSYCSSPGYWGDVPSELERLAGFQPDPGRFEAAANASSGVLRPYLVDAQSLTGDDAKAHADDEFTLDNFWVFTDFWRRVGIIYPDTPENPAMVVRMSKWFGKRLPTG